MIGSITYKKATDIIGGFFNGVFTLMLLYKS